MSNPKPRVLLSWSSGKDCAWALHQLRRQGEVDVVGLLTTFNEAFDRVAMHGVRLALLEAQAKAMGLPLLTIPLPHPCSNELYDQRMRTAVDQAKAAGVTHIAFGDLFLQDVRDYRIQRLMGTGIAPLFPIWATDRDTPTLARAMQSAGLEAILTCVDPKRLDPRFLGRKFDASLLADLPADVDPCGERGEFHTFCIRSPEFAAEIPVTLGETVERDGFWFVDLLPGA